MTAPASASRPFSGLTSPRTPEELRARVLRTCRLASFQPRSRIDRLWESTPLRLAWALSLAGLLLATAFFELSIPTPSLKTAIGTAEAGHVDDWLGPELFGSAQSPRTLTLALVDAEIEGLDGTGASP